MTTVPFDLPLGDSILFDVEGSLEFTDAMCATTVGGPSGTVAGRIIVTEQRLAFRPVVGQPHPQRIDMGRDPNWQIEVVQRRFLGLIRRGAPVVEISYRWANYRDIVMAFHVPDPEAFVEVLRRELGAGKDARTLLREALDDGISDRGRYARMLHVLSFPQGFWHTEAIDDLVDLVSDTFEELGIELDEAWVRGLELDVEPLYGPEDYETGPGSEAWARKEQVERICVAANAVLDGPRRFYQFAEDVPGWEFDEAVWLFLDASERERLLELDIVRPV